MKKLIGLALLAWMIGVPFVGEAQLKVKEKSASKTPTWLNSTEQDYIITSAINEDLERAKNQCMDNVRKYIIEAVAQNVKSSDIGTIEQESVNSGVVHFLDAYAYTYQTESAKVPFMTGVSLSKIEDSYWEKRVDKKSGAVSYLYSIKYPFPRIELKKLIDEFKTQDEKMNKKLLALEAQYNNITAVEQLDKAVNDLPVLVAYFFDDTRKNSAIALQRNYTNLYNNLTIHRFGDELGREKIALKLGARCLSYAKAPVLKSATITQLQATQQDTLWTITYDYSTCIPSEENVIDVVWRVGSKTPKLKLYVDVDQNSIKIRPQKGIRLTAKAKMPAEIADVTVVIPMVADDASLYLIKNIEVTIADLSEPLVVENLDVQVDKKGLTNISFTCAGSFELKESGSFTPNNLLQGYMDVQDKTGEVKRIPFSLPYTKNW